ncbi:MAG: DUF1289 domain-containing protein [Pseudomonadales bacterium]
MQSPPSPCIRNCCLDEADVCIGCGRHVEEIVAWGNADACQRKAIVLRAAQRCEQRQLRHGNAGDSRSTSPDE